MRDTSARVHASQGGGGAIGVCALLPTYEITVSTSPSPGDDLAKVRANAIALANAVIAKLKG